MPLHYDLVDFRIREHIDGRPIGRQKKVDEHHIRECGFSYDDDIHVYVCIACTALDSNGLKSRANPNPLYFVSHTAKMAWHFRNEHKVRVFSSFIGRKRYVSTGSYVRLTNAHAVCNLLGVSVSSYFLMVRMLPPRSNTCMYILVKGQLPRVNTPRSPNPMVLPDPEEHGDGEIHPGSVSQSDSPGLNSPAAQSPLNEYALPGIGDGLNVLAGEAGPLGSDVDSIVESMRSSVISSQSGDSAVALPPMDSDDSDHSIGSDMGSESSDDREIPFHMYNRPNGRRLDPAQGDEIYETRRRRTADWFRARYECPLYPESEISLLSAVYVLLDLKRKGQVPDKVFTLLCKILKQILPRDNILPESYYLC
jgi:hypothetical protein